MHKDERCLHSEIQEQPKLVCRYTHNIVVMHRYKRTYARAGDGASEHVLAAVQGHTTVLAGRRAALVGNSAQRVCVCLELQGNRDLV
jgi:hypothetical protein